MPEEVNFYIDILADDFCDVDKAGKYVLKENVPDSPEDSDNRLSSEVNELVCESSSASKANTAKEEEKDNHNKGRWSTQEHQLFLEALQIYGKEWELVEKHIGTRDAAHVRSHA